MLSYRPFAYVLAAAVALLLLLQYAGLASARSLGLIATPERFTELSFAHPTSLPSVLASSGTISFYFVVANREGADRTYAWSATYSTARSHGVLATGDTPVPTGSSRSVAVEVAAPSAHGATTVSVRLAAPRESIDFHVDIVGARA